MATDEIKVNMTPSHPGEFVRMEIIAELGLNVTQAAEILGVSAGNAFRPTERQRRAVGGDGVADREGVWREYGYAAADAGVV